LDEGRGRGGGEGEREEEEGEGEGGEGEPGDGLPVYEEEDDKAHQDDEDVSRHVAHVQPTKSNAQDKGTVSNDLHSRI
jgi:hypothetical protein